MNNKPFKPKVKRLLVCGFGINDADYRTQWYVDGKRKRCPYYARWHMMLNRSYSPKFHALQPNYIDVSVKEDWRYFSDFKAWMETQYWEGLTLDKDILFPGNKVYGPDTCAFVPQEINLLLTDRLSLRGEYPLGVSYQQKSSDMVNELKDLSLLQSAKERGQLRVLVGTQHQWRLTQRGNWQNRRQSKLLLKTMHSSLILILKLLIHL